MCDEFNNLLLEKGIVSQRSCPYTPQRNGVVVRKNRHLLDVTRTLLIESSIIESSIPSKYWFEVVSSTVYLMNRLSPKVLKLQSLYYRLFSQVS